MSIGARVATQLRKWIKAAWWEMRVNRVLGSALVPVPLRSVLLRRVGIQAPNSTMVASGCYFGAATVAFGERVFVNTDCFFDGLAPITVGDGCDFGMRVTVITSGHELGEPWARAGRLQPLPVHVGDGCWVGANVTIVPGVTIGAGCVIAAGAVVAQDCAPNGVYAGVPARRVRDLSVAAA
jgi:acetyltransferase-like isoleucine patch superfamily enzyme